MKSDWTETTIGDEFELFAGGDVNKDEFSKVKTKKYKYPIYANSLKKDGLYGFTSIARFKADSLTITGRGEIGRAMYRPEKFDAIVRLLVLSPKNFNNALSKFVTYYINERVHFSIESTGVPQLTVPQIKNISLSLPSLQEQKQIATALSDIDKLIESLEKLIDKKKNIKQGTMQQLLSGKKRLEGFSKKWNSVLLGEVTNIKTGSKNNQDKKSNGKYPFFVRSQEIEKIDTYTYDCEAILVPGEGRIGKIIHYIQGKFDVHQRVYKISDFSKVNGKFIFFYMNIYFHDHAMKNTVKATVDSLRLPTFQNFKMYIPVDLNEQKTIAKILSDMGKEIEALEKKLNKYKQIKQGMMQELLTGRIRLV